MLGDEIAATLAWARQAAESLMVDVCEVTRVTSGSFDDSTGTYGVGTVATVYDGPCRVRMAFAQDRAAEAGEAAWTGLACVISVPVTTSTAVKVGDELEVTLSENDPAMEGQTFVVKAIHWQTHSSARRLRCEAVLRDA